MRSLFFRIVLWFWAAVVGLALTFAGTIVVTSYGLVRDRRARTEKAAEISAHAAVTLYRRFGLKGLNDLDSFRPFYLFDSARTEVQGDTAPAAVQDLVERSFAEGAPGTCLRHEGWIACRTATTDSATFAFVMTFPAGAYLRLLLSPREWAILVPALVLVAGLVCYWLARYLTLPITHLRWLTGRLADGDLQVRVEDLSRFHHSEEVQGLASDFNRMAQRIQALLDQQVQFLYDISHELRTPLTRIALAAGLTRQRMTGPVPEEFERIDRELERVNALIGRVLTMARLESGTTMDDAQPVDLTALINEVAYDAALEADTSRVAIHFDPSPSTWVRGHRELLRMAVENVLRNALRHTPERSTISLDLGEHDGVVSLIIRDQGPGVDQADLQRLFDPFFRTDDARAQHPDGVGLGLAMTRRIVEQHGGTMAAHNHERGGLVITMTLMSTQTVPTIVRGPTGSPAKK